MLRQGSQHAEKAAFGQVQVLAHPRQRYRLGLFGDMFQNLQRAKKGPWAVRAVFRHGVVFLA